MSRVTVKDLQQQLAAKDARIQHLEDALRSVKDAVWTLLGDDIRQRIAERVEDEVEDKVSNISISTW